MFAFAIVDNEIKEELKFRTALVSLAHEIVGYIRHEAIYLSLL